MASDANTTRFADMLAAMGAEPRLRIVRQLLKAHPAGLTPGTLTADLGISASTLSHHLDRLKRDGLVNVRRDRTFLHYTANTAAIESLLQFLYVECCCSGCVPILPAAGMSRAQAK